MVDKVFKPVIQVLADKCVNCHRCIAACPVKMCNNGAGDIVEFNSELCIGCGACIQACAHGARRGVDDFDRFLKDVQNGTLIAAIVAPAVAASFNGEYLRINGFLKSLGVKAVFDVSFGAELTVKSYVNYMKQANPKVVIAQPCPTLVSYIEMYRPDLIKYLAPADSPMLHTMKMIKHFYPQYANHKIAAISPCLSKRREFDETGIGDYNITFLSIEQYLETIKKRIESYEQVPYDNPPAERAVLFSSPGGLMRTVERYDPDITSHTRKIEGSEVYHYLAHFENVIKRSKTSVHTLVDCLNCSMGCNGGPGTSNRGKHLDEVECAIEKRSQEARKFYGTLGRSKIGRAFAVLKLEKLLKI
jgi:iron only hydrogenase large subunit-like protein